MPYVSRATLQMGRTPSLRQLGGPVISVECLLAGECFRAKPRARGAEFERAKYTYEEQETGTARTFCWRMLKESADGAGSALRETRVFSAPRLGSRADLPHGDALH